MDIQKELQKAHIFTQLNQRQLDRVEQHAAKKILSAGQFLFVQGDTADRFYYVLPDLQDNDRTWQSGLFAVT